MFSATRVFHSVSDQSFAAARADLGPWAPAEGS